MIWQRAAGWLKALRAHRPIMPTPQRTEDPPQSTGPAPVERRISTAPIQKFRIGLASRFRRRSAEAGDPRLDVTRIGLPTLGPASALDEFHPILDFLHARGALGECRKIAVLGHNDAQQRTTFALNLALAASLSGEATALFEVDRDGNRLAQAIAIHDGPEPSPTPVLRTANRMLLAHAPGDENEGEWTHSRVVQALKNRESPVDWLFCDGPTETTGSSVSAFLDEIDDILVVVTQHDHAIDEVTSLRRALGPNAKKIAACATVDTAIFAIKAPAEAA
jgi:hypothetical protein